MDVVTTAQRIIGRFLATQEFGIPFHVFIYCFDALTTCCRSQLRYNLSLPADKKTDKFM